ncbi:hypothetical protein GGR57DRAFT_514250 [Xylariaceae sp. FL1272]|nr:hypothetical protein GGR57DRAFT_514250 [Xylariaceae sp. FL1272]
MKGRCSLLVFLSLWGAFGVARDPTVRRDNNIANSSDIPTADNFVRRACHTVAVLGDYLYVDGGQVTERVDGSSPADSPAYAVNTTWSIDLTTKWTNKTVPIRSIPKASPRMGKQIHWTDTSSNSLYTWGGFVADASPPPEHEMWKFQADGSGGGEWSQVSQQDYRTFTGLKNPFGASFAQSHNVGYAFGGSVEAASDSSVQKDLPGYALPGLVSYNFQTGEWTNTSTSNYGGYGTNINGRAEMVPFGPNGLLLFLGGAETPVDATNETIVEVSWNSITMVDPITKKWYKQSTTGTKPPTMESHCSVGVAGPNGTYEIFIYGGISDQIRATSGDITVLSLPSFNFFQGPTAVPRSDHGCAIVGKGKRQMLSMGGIDGQNRTFTAPTTADQWTYGLGIFDMTDMQWYVPQRLFLFLLEKTDLYDPNVTAYDSPQVVKQWYAAGSLKNLQWDDEELQGFFMGTNVTNSTIPNEKSTAASTGTIVGGSIGGVAGTAIIVAMALIILRRQRGRNRKSRSSSQDAAVDSDVDGIAEYKPEPWPKDGVPIFYSPHSSVTYSPPPALEAQDFRFGELSGHQDGIVYTGELAGSEIHGYAVKSPIARRTSRAELPVPFEHPRTELPDRNYSQ